jgi:hypothetical protein
LQFDFNHHRLSHKYINFFSKGNSVAFWLTKTSPGYKKKFLHPRREERCRRIKHTMRKLDAKDKVDIIEKKATFTHRNY